MHIYIGKKKGGSMNFFKKFLLVFFSLAFLVSLGSSVFADPIPGDDDPAPPPILPGQG